MRRIWLTFLFGMLGLRRAPSEPVANRCVAGSGLRRRWCRLVAVCLRGSLPASGEEDRRPP